MPRVSRVIEFDEKRPLDMYEELRSLERELIGKALDRSDGVKSRAAQMLGLKRTTLIEKMRILKMALSVPARFR